MITNPGIWVVKDYLPIMSKMSLMKKKELAYYVLNFACAVLAKPAIFKLIGSGIESHFVN